MKKVLFHFNGNLEESLLDLSAVKTCMEKSKEALCFYAKVSDPKVKEIVEDSNLFSKVFTEEPTENYDVVYNQVITPKKKVIFELADRAKKIKMASNILQDKSAIDQIEGVFHNYLGTATKALARRLEKKGTKISFQDINYHPQEGPNLNYSSALKKKVRALLRKKILPEVDLTQYSYCIINTNNTEGYEFWWKVGEATGMDFIVIQNDGSVWTDHNLKLTTSEMAGLVLNENCYGVIGEGWLRYVAWANKSPLLIDICNEGDPWKSPVSNSYWRIEKSTIPTSGILEIIPSLIQRAETYM